MYYYNALLKNLKEERGEPDLSNSEVLDLLTTPRPPIKNENVDNTPNPTPYLVEAFKKSNHMDINHEDVLNVINKMVNSIYDRDENQLDYVKNMAEVRGLDPEPLIKNHCFFSPNVGYMEMTFADLGLYKRDYHVSTSENTLWKGRFIIPLRDFMGNVYGFVGYDKFSNAKYVEWSSPTYKLMAIKALGLDNLTNILESKYCIFTEGSFDYFRGMQHQFSVVANLGIRFNQLLKLLIEKLDVVFTAYDNDDTGRRNMDSIDKLHPLVYHLQYQEIVGKDGKPIKGDMDEALKDPNKVELQREEIEKRIKFKNVRMPKRIII